MSEYIERGALMDKIEEKLACLREVDRNYYSYTNGYEDCYCEVKETPAADVAPVVHSYWEHKITNDGENIGICHNCKYPVSWFWEQAKYCLNCGAKMDGGDGDDDETD